MHYAKHDEIGQAAALPVGAVEITAEQYTEALSRLCGTFDSDDRRPERITIIDGAITFYRGPVQQVDAEGFHVGEAEGLEEGAPLVTTPPPTDLARPRWNGGAWVEGETDAEAVARLLPIKIAEINSACEEEIVSGFESSALGAPHTYQSDRDDQLNLIGMAADGLGGPFKCRDGAGVWEFRPHTVAQLRQVITDGKAVKLALLQRAAELKAAAAEAKTPAELEAVVW